MERDDKVVGEVWHQNEVVGYLTSTLRACTWAVRETLNTEAARAVHGYTKLPVHAEAPMDVKSYPYVQVLYRNDRFEPEQISERDTIPSPESGVPGEYWEQEYVPYIFEGTVTVNVYATSILERERISDCIIGQLGASLGFRQRLIKNQWVNIHPNMATLASATANETWGTPWSANEMTCFRTFTFKVEGEFYYRRLMETERLEYIGIMAKIDENARV